MPPADSAPEVLRYADFEVVMVRSARRKTAALQISAAGVVSLRLPMRFSGRRAEAFVRSKSNWITQKLAQQSPLPVRQFIVGETHAYLGERYPLVHVLPDARGQHDAHAADAVMVENAMSEPEMATTAKMAATMGAAVAASISCSATSTGVRANLCWADGQFQLRAAIWPGSEIVQKLLARWYRQAAADYFDRRTAEFAAQMGLQPTKISTRFYKARWGSCNARAELSFNWQLIQAPVAVVDYVIVHELSHITHLNHSADFWALVARYYPHYRTTQQWLKESGAGLLL